VWRSWPRTIRDAVEKAEKADAAGDAKAQEEARQKTRAVKQSLEEGRAAAQDSLADEDARSRRIGYPPSRELLIYFDGNVTLMSTVFSAPPRPKIRSRNENAPIARDLFIQHEFILSDLRFPISNLKSEI
jgi:hypothetical protein